MWHRKKKSNASNDSKEKKPSSSSRSNSSTTLSLPQAKPPSLTTRPHPPSSNALIPPTSRPALTSLTNIDRKEASTSSAHPAPAAWRPLLPSGPRHPVANTSGTRPFPPSGSRAPASNPTSHVPASLAHIDRTNPRTSTTTPQQPLRRPPTSSTTTQPSKSRSPSPGPPKTAYTNPHDIEMATMHAQYHALAPSKQKEQDEWAALKLRDNMPPCPSGYGWERKKKKKGYKCIGGAHFVSDELLIEGNGGWYELRRSGKWRGPLYEVEVEVEVEDSDSGSESNSSSEEEEEEEESQKTKQGKGKGKGK